MSTSISTMKELKAAIRKAKAIYIVPRFGVSEMEVKISRKEATTLIATLPADATPESLDMYGGHFGSINDDGTISLG